MSNEKKMAQTVVLGDLLGMTSYPAMWGYGIIIFKTIRYYKYKDPHSTTSISMESTVPLCFFSTSTLGFRWNTQTLLMTPVDLKRKNDPKGGGDAGFQGLGDCGEVRVSGILVGLPEGWVTAWKILGVEASSWRNWSQLGGKKPCFQILGGRLLVYILEIFAADDFLRLVHLWMSNTSMNFEFWSFCTSMFFESPDQISKVVL